MKSLFHHKVKEAIKLELIACYATALQVSNNLYDLPKLIECNKFFNSLDLTFEIVELCYPQISSVASDVFTCFCHFIGSIDNHDIIIRGTEKVEQDTSILMLSKYGEINSDNIRYNLFTTVLQFLGADPSNESSSEVDKIFRYMKRHNIHTPTALVEVLHLEGAANKVNYDYMVIFFKAMCTVYSVTKYVPEEDSYNKYLNNVIYDWRVNSVFK